MNHANASASIPELTLYLDIDSKKEILKDFSYEGALALQYKNELEELKHLTLGKTLAEVKSITRGELRTVDEKKLTPVGLWLLKKALRTYLGEERSLREHSDMLCLCFAVTKKDIVEKVLADKDFELKTLIQATMASSACGTCRMPIEKLIRDIRNQHGLVKGLDHSKSRFDSEGKWIKVAGMYPGPLLIKLEELKNEWMDREKIHGQFTIEFMNIEGHHLEVKIDSTNQKTVEGLLSALSDYLKSRLGVLFFLKGL